MMSMFGNSYHSGGPLSQNSMGMLNDVNNNDGSPFDLNDFPQLSSRPSSSGGSQGQIGKFRVNLVTTLISVLVHFLTQSFRFVTKTRAWC